MEGIEGLLQRVPSRFDSALAPSAAVIRGLDPRLHPLCIYFVNLMDARVEPWSSPRMTIKLGLID
jgi:hypothetical protein